MNLIALTGGIASGKSTIGRKLAELGAVRIDADQLAREAVEGGSPGLARVLDRFGAEVLRSDGTLDRVALGARVFAHPDELDALNAIVHPEVLRLYRDRVEAARREDPEATIIYEIPLLAETGRQGEWDLVIVADAPVETRVQRMVQLRNMSETEAQNRVANQASDAERRAIADVIIDTSGSEADTIAQVESFWERLGGDVRS